MLPQEIQHIIKTLPPESQVVVEAIVAYYESVLQQSAAEIKSLKDQIAQTSKNSSKPPSSDGYNKPAPKSLRRKTSRKQGGQKGHQGHTLKLSEVIDETITHQVKSCTNCYTDLREHPVLEYIRRQEYDIPVLRMLVTEHLAEVKQCSCGCVNKAAMPPQVSHYVQYGPNIKTLMIYLQDYQLLPYERSSQLVNDLFEHKISQGTLYNFRQRAFESLESFEIDL